MLNKKVQPDNIFEKLLTQRCILPKAIFLTSICLQVFPSSIAVQTLLTPLTRSYPFHECLQQSKGG